MSKKDESTIDQVEGKIGQHKSDFLNFLREQGVVGLAVGFVLGGAAASVVSALTDDLLDPLIGILIKDKEGLTSVTVTIAGSEFLIGHFLVTLLDFIIVALVIYILVKILHVDKIDKKKEEKK